MITLILASMLSCADGYWIIEGIDKSNITNKQKSELRIEILSSMPEHCSKENYELRS